MVEMEESGICIVQIFSEKGELVRTLVDGIVPAGKNEFIWVGLDDQGNTEPFGIYFARIKIGDDVSTRKMVLVG